MLAPIARIYEWFRRAEPIKLNIDYSPAPQESIVYVCSLRRDGVEEARVTRIDAPKFIRKMHGRKRPDIFERVGSDGNMVIYEVK